MPRHVEQCLWHLDGLVSIDTEGESPQILCVECASEAAADFVDTLVKFLVGIAVRRKGLCTLLIWEDE